MPARPLKDDEYVCAGCHGVFIKGWSDEEASTEFAIDFHGCPKERSILICEDCYNIAMARFNPVRPN